MLTPDDIAILNTWTAIADRWLATAERIQKTVQWCISHRTMKGIEEMDFAFDPTGITPGFSGGGGQLPVGKHPVIIVKSEGKPTKDNTGGFLELTVEAIDGPAKGGSMPLRLNVHNTSETAVRIAKEQLAALCAVTGTGPFANTMELHNKPFVVEVTPQKNDPKYTEITAVFDMNGNAPADAKPPQNNGNGNGGGNGGGFGGGNGGGGASGTGTIPQQQNGAGGGGGFGGGNGNGGGGGFGGGNGGGGGGGGWQQGGGAGAGGGGGSGPGWGQR